MKKTIAFIILCIPFLSCNLKIYEDGKKVKLKPEKVSDDAVMILPLNSEIPAGAAFVSELQMYLPVIPPDNFSMENVYKSAKQAALQRKANLLVMQDNTGTYDRSCFHAKMYSLDEVSFSLFKMKQDALLRERLKAADTMKTEIRNWPVTDDDKIFAKSVFHHPSKYMYYVNFNADGQEHNFHYGWRVVGNFVNGRASPEFLVGYNPFSLNDAYLYVNRPYLNYPDSEISTTTGIVTYVGKSRVVFQYASDKPNKEPSISAQAATPQDIKRYGIRPGARFLTDYQKGFPEKAVLYYNKNLPDSAFCSKDIFLPKPNGFFIGGESKWIMTQNPALNSYLKKYNQSATAEGVPFFLINGGWQYKSGLWFGTGGGGFPSDRFEWDFSLGYQQKLSRRYYLNFSTQFSYLLFDINSFRTNELKSIADTSQFSIVGWFLNPKIELVKRKISNNVWGTQFLKVGAGVMINLNADKWHYEIGHDVKANNGSHSTEYNYAQTLQTIPPFAKYMFTCSIAYSFESFKRQ